VHAHKDYPSAIFKKRVYRGWKALPQVKGKSTFIKEEKRQTPMIVIEPRIRLDDWEMRADVQQAVAESWEKVTTENLAQYADLNGFREEFLRHHGFGMPGINYSQPVDPTRI